MASPHHASSSARPTCPCAFSRPDCPGFKPDFVVDEALKPCFAEFCRLTCSRFPYFLFAKRPTVPGEDEEDMYVQIGRKRERSRQHATFRGALHVHLCNCFQPVENEAAYYVSPSVASEDKVIQTLQAMGCSLNPGLEAPFLAQPWNCNEEEEEEEEAEEEEANSNQDEGDQKSGKKKTKKVRRPVQPSDCCFRYDEEETESYQKDFDPECTIWEIFDVKGDTEYVPFFILPYGVGEISETRYAVPHQNEEALIVLLDAGLIHEPDTEDVDSDSMQRKGQSDDSVGERDEDEDSRPRKTTRNEKADRP